MKFTDIKSERTNVISIGNNMGKLVITKSILVKDENNELAIENGGISIRCYDVHDLYIDNKENRKILKAKIAS